MKTLSHLCGREITFQLPDGQEVNVAPLAIRFFDEYLAILRDTEQSITSDSLTSGRIRMRNLISHVWPLEHRKLLYHFDYVGLCHLARVLFFGEKAERRTVKAGSQELEKQSIAKEIDLLLMAGRILHNFPSFTLEKLLDMPLQVFLELDALVYRVQADCALQTLIPAVAAGMGTESAVKTLNEIRESSPDHNIPAKQRAYSQKELEKAIAKLSAPRTNEKVIRAGRQLME